MGILTDNMKRYVAAKKKQGYNVSEYNKRLIEYATEGLEDLRYIAERVNRRNDFKQADVEKIQRGIFKSEALQKLLESILLSKRIDESTQLEIAKAMVEMLPEVAQRLCNEDYQKLILSGHDHYRASLYAIKWADFRYHRKNARVQAASP